MTVLVPNTDEEARLRLPATGDAARLTWSAEQHPHGQEPRAAQYDELTSRGTSSDVRSRAEISRRRLLRRGAAGALSVSALSYLAACGVETGGSSDERRAPASSRRSRRARSATPSTWPTGPCTSRRTAGTLKEFEKEYGAKVKYAEEINDNTEFFGKVRQQYERGDSGGVTSSWSPTGWPRHAPPRLRAEAGPGRASRRGGRPDRPAQVTAFDPKRDSRCRGKRASPGSPTAMTWSVEPRSVDDLFDPEYKGKVTMLTEMRDSVGGLTASDRRRPRDGHARRVQAGRREDQRGPPGRARYDASPATTSPVTC